LADRDIDPGLCAANGHIGTTKAAIMLSPGCNLEELFEPLNKGPVEIKR